MPRLISDDPKDFDEFHEIGPIERRLVMDEWLRVFLYACPSAPKSELLKLQERIDRLQMRRGGGLF